MSAEGTTTAAAGPITAKDICQHFELSEEAAPLVQENQKPRELLHLLAENKLYSDAVSFLAHALPRREAVWWGLVCARAVAGEKPAPKILTALRASEKWLMEPNEENRRAAKAASDAAGLGTPAGCVALGAFLSGGSIGPPDVPEIPPGDYFTAAAIAGGVTLATLTDDEEEEENLYRRFIAEGNDVARGKKPWRTQ